MKVLSGVIAPVHITLSLPCGEQKRQNPHRVKDWEIIADNLSKAGWSWGCVSALDAQGRTIWIADAHRDDGNRFILRANEKLTAFVELECAIRASDESPRKAGTIRLSSRPNKSDYGSFPPNELDQARSWLAE